MHGTRPSFYGNKRNLKEELGVGRGVGDDRGKRRRIKMRRMYWNVSGDRLS